MNKKVMWGIAIALVLVSCLMPMTPRRDTLHSDQMGQLHQATIEAEEAVAAGDTSSLAAAYGDTHVLKETVDYYYTTRSQSGMYENVTKKGIIDEILTSVLLYEEAVAQGLAPSEEDLQREYDSMNKNYEKHRSMQKEVDTFCENAGITLEEYWEDAMESIERTMARENLKLEFAREWCPAHDVDLDDAPVSDEFLAAWAAYGQALLEAHQDEITYYVTEE